MTEHIELDVTLPDVVEEPRVLIVRCGESTVEVKEHGHVGSGQWAVWTGAHVVYGGTAMSTIEGCAAAARDRVQADERRRLFHKALRDAL